MTAASRGVDDSNIVTKCPFGRRIRVTARVQHVHPREYMNVRETRTHGMGRKPTGGFLYRGLPCSSISNRCWEQTARPRLRSDGSLWNLPRPRERAPRSSRGT